MGNILKRLFSLLFAVSLVCLQAAPVFAEGTETTPLGHSSVIDSDAVSTWDELAAWMNAHVNEGGSVRLTAPIVFDGTYAALTRRPGASPATLDLGEFGLTVSGDLEMYCPGLTIRGQGGKNASLRALPGGSLALGYIDANSGENGAVLWQDEGGILTLEQPVAAGAVHFATRPIAELTYPRPQTISVMPGENAADKLPKVMQVRVHFEGASQVEELPVVWDLTDEETAESLAERRRTLISGEFADMDTFGVVSCILAFLDRPITFTVVLAQNYKGVRTINADFTRPADSFTAAVEYSFDEERWETAQQSEFAANDDAEVMLHFYEPDEAEEGDLIWDTEINPTLYLRICWLDAANEADAYSDELAFDGETMKISSDTGGNRGGGTDLNPPETLPPPIGGDGTGDEDNYTPETPPHTDAVPTQPPKIEETPLPPLSSTASIPKTATDKADTFTPQTESDTDVAAEQTGTPLPSTEQSEPAQEVLAAVTPDPPVSNRAVGQVAAGTAATGGVIALTMTYPHWGGRLTAFLRRLLVKH